MYTIEAIPIKTRRDAISQRDEIRTQIVTFRSVRTPMRVISIDTKYLCYRLVNMRTRPAQVLRETALKAPDYFAKNQENLIAQQEQHEILVQMSKQNTANIFQELETKAEQGDALVITADGIIVDGNRRLSAMRELLSIDPVRFRKFRDVEVVILPSDATAQEISRFEVDVQIRPELKLAYTWVAQALGLENQMKEFAMTTEDVATIWGEKATQISERLESLNLAREYLDWIEKTNEFEHVMNDEFAITELAKQLKNDTDSTASEIEAMKYSMFAILKDPDVSDRKLKYASKIRAISKIVTKELHDVGEISLSTGENTQSSIRGGLPSRPVAVQPENPLAQFDASYFRVLDNSEKISEKAQDAMEQLRDDQRSSKVNQSLDDAAKKSVKLLLQAFENKSNLDTSTFSQSMNNLVSTVSYSLRLMSFMVSIEPDLMKNIPQELSPLLVEAEELLHSLRDI